jgi:Zn-dependent protease
MPQFDLPGLLQQLSIMLIPGIFAITLHEVSHGWAAKYLGDPTAYMLGRLTLNPFKHIDPLGTVIVPIGMYLLSGFAFGWAKPVPVAFRNLRHPKRDMVLVAAAGPLSNFAMATLWAVVGAGVLATLGLQNAASQWIYGMCLFGIQINVILGVFNLVPIPPLDGGRVLSGLLPAAGSNLLDRIEPFGFIIVIVLMMAPGSPLFRLLDPIRRFFLDFYFAIVGLA